MTKIARPGDADRLALRKTSLLSGLNADLVDHVVDATRILTAEKGEFVYREGTDPTCFYMVLGGFVRLFRTGRCEREADICIFGPGETFGECMLFEKEPHRFTAQAAGQIRIACLSLEKVLPLLRREPDLAFSLMQLMSRHLLDARENVANDRLHTAPQRVANYLLELSSANGIRKSGAIRLPFQKSLVAGKLGLAPEALSRALASLKRDGIAMRGRIIEISDVDILRSAL